MVAVVEVVAVVAVQAVVGTAHHHGQDHHRHHLASSRDKRCLLALLTDQILHLCRLVRVRTSHPTHGRLAVVPAAVGELVGVVAAAVASVEVHQPENHTTPGLAMCMVESTAMRMA